MADAVELVINMAFSAASKRGGKDDVILGTIAALRRIRAAAEEAGGRPAVAAVDDTIRHIGVTHNARRLGRTRAAPVPARLPEPRSSARVAVAIFEDAANTCLQLNALTPDNWALGAAINLLTDRLIALLGGPPDLDAVVRQISATPEKALGGALAIPSAPGLSVH
jgi:hypothetical protein